jgi:hypothetical protein
VTSRAPLIVASWSLGRLTNSVYNLLSLVV